MIGWYKITSEQALDEAIRLSDSRPVLLFKHSFRCSISATALSRLERSWHSADEALTPYFIDVIASRPVSNAIAARFGVQHESPQALIIRHGKCVYHASHLGISYSDMEKAMQSES